MSRLQRADDLAVRIYWLMSPLRTPDSVVKLEDAGNACQQARLRR
ncbi:hypothetical protein SKC41_26515 [Mycobacterium sp. 050128]